MPALHRSFKVLGRTVGTVDLELNSIICKGMNISDISSKILDLESSLEFQLSGIHMKCSIPKFAAHLDKLPIGSGSGLVTVYNSSIQDTVQITGEGGFATKTVNKACKPNVKTEVKLKLKALSSLVNLILKWAQEEIDKELNTVICSETDILVDRNLTNVLHHVDLAMKPYLPPLCCQPNPLPPVPAGMINWNESSIVSAIDYVLDYLIGPNGPISINKIVNETTSGSGILSIQSEFSTLLNTSIGPVICIDISNATISGLNTFTSLDVFGKTEHPNVLDTSLSAESLNISLAMQISVLLQKGATISGNNLTERFNLNIVLNEPSIFVRTLIAMNENFTLGLEMGQLLEPSCLASTFFDVNFTEISLNFTLTELKMIAAGGSVEGDIDETINNVAKFFLDKYSTVVPELIHGVMMGPFTRLTNEAVDQIRLNMSKGGCPQPAIPSGPSYVDWTNGTLSNLLLLANDFVGVDGPLSINWVMQQLLNADSDGVARKPWELARFQIQSNMQVVLHDLIFHGVGSFSNFSFFDPVDNRTLHSRLDWANQNGPVNISFGVDTIVGSPSGNEKLYRDSFRIEFHLNNFNFATTGIFEVDKAKLQNLTVSQVANPYCDATALADGKFINLHAHVDDAHVRFFGGHTESLIDMERSLPKYDLLSTELVNYLFKVGAPFIETTTNSISAEAIRDSEYLCSNEPIPSNGGSTSRKQFYEKVEFLVPVIISGAIAIFISLYCIFRCICRKSSNNEGADYRADFMYTNVNSRSRNDISTDVKGKPNYPEPKTMQGGNSFPPWNCLAANSQIPVIFRIGVPIVLAGNIATFVFSNKGVGAAVKLKLRVGEVAPELPTLFEFSLVNTIVDMWKAGVYPLSILVAVFSGGWPYLKLALMMICWLFPLSWLPETRRETLLMALDALGKWSLIDAYVLSLMLVAFRFSISNSGDEVGTQFFSADVIVNPELGFYLFLLATIASLLTTHVVLHYHRFSDRSKKIESGGEKEALCNHIYPASSYGLRGHGRVLCTRFGKFLISFLLVVAFAVILAGSIIESFKFEFKGLAGLFLGNQANRGYSLLSVTHAIPQAAENPNFIGVIWIQAVFYTVSFAVPLTHLVVMIFLWWVPMTARTQYSVFYFTEVLNAWSALDVFVVSIMAAILEIQQFAEFLVGDKCDVIDSFLKEYMNNDLDGYNTCFTVIATLSDGCWVLFFACVVSITVSQTVMQTCHKAMHDRLEHRHPLLNESDHVGSEERRSKCLEKIGRLFLRVGILRKETQSADWIRYIDSKTNCAYYKHSTSGRVTWESPEEYTTHISAFNTHEITHEDVSAEN